MIEVDATRLEEAIEQLEVALDAELREALDACGWVIADSAKDRRGINGGWKDRSGNLAESIVAGEVRGTLESGLFLDVTAGGLFGVHYAPYIEFGPRRGIRPRLFLATAIVDTEREVAERIEAAVSRAFEKAGF